MNKFNLSLVSSIFRNLPNFIVIGLMIVGGLFAFKEFKAFTTKFGIDLKGIRDDRFDEKQRQIDALNRQYLQLSENIARAQTNIVSGKEIEEMFIKTIDARVQEIVKQNKEQVVALGKAFAKLESNLQLNVPFEGSRTFQTPQGDTITIYWTYAYADSQEGKRGIRLAQAVFDATNNEFDNYTEPLKFEVTSLRTEQVSGTPNHYVEFGVYSPSDNLYNKDNMYKLGIDTVVVFEREIKESRWFFPEPHLEGGFGSNFFIGSPTVGFDVGVSLIAYGRTAHDNYLRFARIGIGITDDTDRIFGSFSPIGLNVRTLGVPFLKDTWIFPGISVRKSGGIGFSASFSTTF